MTTHTGSKIEDENTATEASGVAAEATKPVSRDEMRRLLIGNVPKPTSKLIMLYGVSIELRQPEFGNIMKAQEETNAAKRAADMIVKYAYVPGTDDQVFEEGDLPSILKWPFNEDLVKLQEAIADLTGIDIGEATKEIHSDPLSA